MADGNSEVPLAFLSEVIASKTCSEPIMNTLQPMLTYIFIGVSGDEMLLREFQFFFFFLNVGAQLDGANNETRPVQGNLLVVRLKLLSLGFMVLI